MFSWMKNLAATAREMLFGAPERDEAVHAPAQKQKLSQSGSLTTGVGGLLLTSRQRGNALLKELSKPADDINTERCLSLIIAGVNLDYPDWKTMQRDAGDDKLQSFARYLAMEPGSVPSDPEAFFQACAKGKTSVVQALIDHKVIYPLQWDRATGEDGKMVAAKNGQVEVYKLLDEFWRNIPIVGADTVLEALADKNHIIHKTYTRAPQDKEPTNKEGKTAYDLAKEAGQVNIVEYAVNKRYESLYGMDWRHTDFGYEDEVKFHQETLAREVAETKQAAKTKFKL